MNEKEAARKMDEIGFENFRREHTAEFAPRRAGKLPVEIIEDPSCPPDKIFLLPPGTAIAEAERYGENPLELFGVIENIDYENKIISVNLTPDYDPTED